MSQEQNLAQGGAFPTIPVPPPAQANGESTPQTNGHANGESKPSGPPAGGPPAGGPPPGGPPAPPPGMDKKPLGSYPDTGIDVLIVGTGLAGLTAALECLRKGHKVRVLERNPDINTQGDMYFMGHSATKWFKHWPELEKEYNEIGMLCRVKTSSKTELTINRRHAQRMDLDLQAQRRTHDPRIQSIRPSQGHGSQSSPRNLPNAPSHLQDVR